MFYDRIEPDLALTNLIDCYWVIESNDRTPRQQKIIPDGFPEIIFHYRDPYQTNLSGKWEDQSNKLFSGQIRNHFLLENTGSSGMIGIKFKPAAIAQLFGVEMKEFTDKVVDLDIVLEPEFHFISEKLLSPTPYFEKVDLLNQFFTKKKADDSRNSQLIEQALELIFREKGVVSVSDLISALDVGERKLERLFNKYVGLSPKFYSRIIRFNYIFQLIQKQKLSWSEVAQLSGYYDQSHFISNFQEFSGEEPSTYFFEDKNMANFFLKRPVEN